MRLQFTIITFILLSFSSCKKNTETLVDAFIDTRNNYDIELLNTMIDKDYQELFQDEFLEIENKETLHNHILWAKELSSKTTIDEVILANDSLITTIESNTNYMDIALKRTPRTFKVTYYIKNDKIQKQSFDTLVGYNEKNIHDQKLLNEFEVYCEENDLGYYTMEMTQEAGKLFRKALELYANRK
ncbi:hypothetical protein H2O64_01940 [Kordia sp. YSTF-M3]|uniref:DUF4468 domain-containing protein n=1 Tax=Kordia aestuariivivens TaxID=2759037 RepID=A0ABR7Q4N8_9FLAO|nr:hypothetical protein [Kordia aestuariivivens]MBC8753413.1 hypothetical protein [Kordia aestuariivivens]